jgi:carbamoylphosphate synthase small subunit
MIAGFDDITEELTNDELKLVQPLINGLKTKTSDNPVKAPFIVKGMNAYAEKHGLIKISEVRLRKLVNYIRSNGIAPVIATSKGYYMSTDQEEIKLQIESLKQRARSILSCANGLEKFLK